MLAMKKRCEAEEQELRGVSDHGFIHSIYLRDPNGYVIELAARIEGDANAFDKTAAHDALTRWQQHKS